jgi:hypothetical protein
MRRPNRGPGRYTPGMPSLYGVPTSEESHSGEASQSHVDDPVHRSPRPPRRPRWRVRLSNDARTTLAIGIALGVLVGWFIGRSHGPPASRQGGPVTAWAPPGTPPLSDAEAAALVSPQPESQRENQAANDYVPTDAQLAAFHAAQKRLQAAGDFNPLTAYVTGRPGIKDPSTDDLIQWVSHKWGIPTDWIRAEMEVESHWRQSQRGDLTTVSPSAYALYPAYSRVPGTDSVYESLGIAQVKWIPDASAGVGVGTEPLRWASTAFNLDYYAATVRYYYDGDCHWCSAGYQAGQAWDSIGAWFSPQPWGNAGARQYVSEVQAALGERAWPRPGS